MEVDEEIDGLLSTQFDALNTRDRHDVIAEFKRLVGPHAATVNDAGCAFWLDMFNWYVCYPNMLPHRYTKIVALRFRTSNPSLSYEHECE